MFASLMQLRSKFSFFIIYFLIFTFSYLLLYKTGLTPDFVTSEATAPLTLQTKIILLGILAGALQFVGYIAYIRNENIDPNPVSWFMFAYGTGILTLLEWDAKAFISELILPTVCAVLGIYVSYRCWKKSKIMNPAGWWPRDWWPEDIMEQWSFISDMLITVAYIGAWVLASYAFLSEDTRHIAVIIFLFLSNVSTFPSFYPILRETYLHPYKEHWLPWTIWAMAYGILGIVSFHVHETIWHLLMFYPLSNMFLHGLVAIIAVIRAGDDVSSHKLAST